MEAGDVIFAAIPLLASTMTTDQHCLPPTETPTNGKNAKADRAARLHAEGVNCLAIAVREKAPGFAADLIDEAARLIRRSAELAPPDPPK